MRSLLLALTIPLALSGQTFDAVSIKISSPNTTGTDITDAPGRLTAEGITALNLLQFAFGARESELLNLPDWASKQRFDVDGVTATPVEMTRENLRPLLQSLFQDRFGMSFHREIRQLPVYSLTVGKSGIKMPPHAGNDPSYTGIHVRQGKHLVNARATGMRRLAEVLSQQTDRFVVDNTGLTATYDFDLEWDSNLGPGAEIPSIFTAIQEQLGLRLDSTRGPVEVIIIDRLERPSEN